jgi:hypothetical protein
MGAGCVCVIAAHTKQLLGDICVKEIRNRVDAHNILVLKTLSVTLLTA